MRPTSLELTRIAAATRHSWAGLSVGNVLLLVVTDLGYRDGRHNGFTPVSPQPLARQPASVRVVVQPGASSAAASSGALGHNPLQPSGATPTRLLESPLISLGFAADIEGIRCFCSQNACQIPQDGRRVSVSIHNSRGYGGRTCLAELAMRRGKFRTGQPQREIIATWRLTRCGAGTGLNGYRNGRTGWGNRSALRLVPTVRGPPQDATRSRLLAALL